MPSHAVLRKKQRRVAKRKKTEEDGNATSHRVAPPHLDDEGNNPSSPHRTAHAKTAAVPPSRKRAHEAAVGPSTLISSPSAPSDATAAAAAAAADNVVPAAQRVRREPPPAPAAMPPGLTRKERHRWETSQRLERQMTRLTTTAAAVQEMAADAAAQKAATGGTVDGGETATDGVAAEMKLRHDPKFKHGTFWRDRKERRARTLFLGGIPAHFTAKQVTDFISTVVDSDPNAIDYVDQIGKDTEVVEAVDMLPVKHQSKVKHMYVTMASVPLAGCAAAMLDRYKMEGRELRCNFAADKTQREEAIRRRNAVQQ